MQVKVVWQYGSNHPDNAKNFETIRTWWSKLKGKEVVWVQRLIPEYGGMSEIHWQPQRFDEDFIMVDPEIRGITLYWYKLSSPIEHNTTVQKLELDNIHQHLYIYPQTQPELVIRVSAPDVKYQTIELSNVELDLVDKQLLILRDASQQLEIKVKLGKKQLDQLLEKLL